MNRRPPMPAPSPLRGAARAATPPKWRSRFGLTLVELLVVVAILGLVAAMVVVGTGEARERAEEAVSLQQVQRVREAVLRFRSDMGYYPGEGPLAGSQLDLSAIGGEPRTIEWADHPMNFWQLFVKPVDRERPERWTWNPANARGWRGPYLQLTSNDRLDVASGKTGVMPGRVFPDASGLHAIGDLMGEGGRPLPGMQWRGELPGQSPAAAGGQGSPILFERWRDTVAGFDIYRLVSPGGAGHYPLVGAEPDSRQIVIEVARRPLILPR